MTETEIRTRNEIVRKMRRRHTNGANWRGSCERRRRPIRRCVCPITSLSHTVTLFSAFLFNAERLRCIQQRLKNWELRERKKARDYAKEMEREDERRREMVNFLVCVL